MPSAQSADSSPVPVLRARKRRYPAGVTPVLGAICDLYALKQTFNKAHLSAPLGRRHGWPRVGGHPLPRCSGLGNRATRLWCARPLPISVAISQQTIQGNAQISVSARRNGTFFLMFVTQTGKPPSWFLFPVPPPDNAHAFWSSRCPAHPLLPTLRAWELGLPPPPDFLPPCVGPRGYSKISEPHLSTKGGMEV